MSDTLSQAARVIALSYGVDPDDYAPLSTMCTADNQPVLWWQVYEEQAQALRDAGLLVGGEPVHFQWNHGWKLWEQVIPEAAGKKGVFAAYGLPLPQGGGET
ncbi:hypothetical protein [Phenylobacterium sp.]|uniref:hypothetical protein n=1 Tax=Phenylobacterium sp. TaxID=1871053 RepID=UPI003001D215